MTKVRAAYQGNRCPDEKSGLVISGVTESHLLALPVRKISYPDVFEFHVAVSAGVQLQCDLAIE